MATRTNKAVKGAITSLVQFSVLVVLQAILAPVILKNGGQEVLGAYAIVMQIIGYGLILDFGLGVALSRYLSQSFSDSDENEKFIKIFNIGRYLILLTNMLLSIFIIVLALNVESLITSSNAILAEARNSLYLLSVWVIIRTPLVLYGHGLLASQNMATANIIGLVGSASRLVLSLYLIYAGYGLIGLVFANVVTEFIGLMLQKIYFNKLYPKIDLTWRRPNITLTKNFFAFGLKYWGVNIAAVLTVGSDSIIVGHLYGAAVAAIFYTTKIPSFLITQIIYKISDNSASAINELFAKGSYDSVKSAYLKILRYSLLLAVPVAIGIVGFNKGIISVWVGLNQYAGSVMSFALAGFLLTQVISHINAMITLAAGNLRNWMMISLVTGLVSIALAYALGKFFGMQWVMVAIAVMDIPVLIFLMRRVIAGLDLSYERVWHESIRPAVLAALPLFCWVVFVIRTDQATNIVRLVACIIVFALLWLLGLYTLGFNKSERQAIRSKINFI
jgi:O-antigen/teichoic acid export membrane protein